MNRYFVGEIRGTIMTNNLNFYIKEKDDISAENKLLEYYENELMRTIGELASITIYEISSSEYYGRMKYNYKYL